ncbi:MAG: 2-phospho-L-lactate guanylyltransferase [Chloroflexi bacterium]|nr:2-phospho-L-lactate guanylyltransferase [Chloroflexota bacterium]
MEVQKVWVIVPVKTLGEAKSRLSPVMTTAQRRQLAFQMADHTLSTLSFLLKKDIIGGFLVVSRDPVVKDLTRKYNGVFLAEEKADTHPVSALNAALSQAARWCTGNFNPSALLILHSDLPFLRWEDLANFLHQAQNQPEQAQAIISPDRRGRGTNCLLLQPPDLLNFEFFFGENSFFKYQNIFKKNTDLQPVIYPLPNLGFDLDYPEDLAALTRPFPNQNQGCKSTAI